jgi:hypothetical protein
MGVEDGHEMEQVENEVAVMERCKGAQNVLQVSPGWLKDPSATTLGS